MSDTALYARISDDQSGLARGVERQIEDCLEICLRKSWPLPGPLDRFVDNDISASADSKKARKRYVDLLDAIRAGRYRRVVMWAEDRTHRQVLELAEFIDLCRKHGVKVASAGTEYDVDDPDQVTMWFIKVRFAEAEVEKQKRRLRRAQRQRVAKGEPATGGRPRYGWEYLPFTRSDGTTGYRWTGRLDNNQIEGVDEEITPVQVIQEAAKRVLAGQSLRAVVADLNRRGIPSPAGHEWMNRDLKRLLDLPPATPEETALWEELEKRLHTGEELKAIRRDWNSRGTPRVPPGRWIEATLKGILISPVTVGHHTDHGEITKRNVFPAVLDDLTYRRLVRKLTDPARNTGAGRGRSYPLTGDRQEELSVCGNVVDGRLCWGPMTGRRDARGDRIYRCKKCGNVTRDADRAEALIRDVLFDVHDSEEFRRARASLDSADETQAKINHDLDALAERKAELHAMVKDPRIPFNGIDLVGFVVEIDKEEKALNLKLEALHPASVLDAFPQHGQDLRDAWAAEGVDWQHAFIKAYIRYIVYLPVGKGCRSDLGIKVIWQSYYGDPAKLVAETIRQAKAESPAFVPHGRSRYRQGCDCEVCVAAHEQDLERRRRWRQSPKRREWERQHRERNRERLNEQARQRRARDPEKAREANRRWRERARQRRAG